MRSTPVLLFLAVLVALPAGGFAERAPLRVGDVEARPGGKASGLLIMIEKDYGIRIDNRELGEKVFASLSTLATYISENSPRLNK